MVASKKLGPDFTARYRRKLTMPNSIHRAPRFLIILCAAAALWAIPTTAHAYIDPGAGSLILQVLLGGIAGVLLLLKTYWHRFTGSGGSGKQSEKPPTHKDNPPS
jgi:hypothetical protein